MLLDSETPLLIDGFSLQVQDVIAVSEHHQPVQLSETALPRIAAARSVIENVLKKKQIVYGINTGFGYLKNQVIPAEDLEELQHNLILSHACGVGEDFSEATVRGIMLLRANTLVQGHSGARLELVEQIITYLNRGIHPRIPAQGSVGASGDLAPLAHLALALIGEGEVHFKGQKRPTQDLLSELKIQPLRLQAKEGLALINGTQPMSSLACQVIAGFKELLDLADLIASMSIQAGLGSRQAFRPELHALRPHPGQRTSAALLWHWLADSEIMESHDGCDRVQDAYSFRCVPQVHGASRDTLRHLEEVIQHEINAVTDNPIILPETGEIISCGHFHGQPVALIMDFAGIAIAELANISERRIERLVNPQLNQGLPPFLTRYGGLHSGFMISQYAAASLVSENKVLAHPASVDSIPTSANQEDHVSMGTTAANKALKILRHSQQVLAIELLCACQALDLRAPLKPSAVAQAVLKRVRSQIPVLDKDRYMAPDQEQALKIVRSGDIYRLIQLFKPDSELL